MQSVTKFGQICANEPFDFIKDGKRLEYLNDYRFLNKNPTSRSSVKILHELRSENYSRFRNCGSQ